MVNANRHFQQLVEKCGSVQIRHQTLGLFQGCVGTETKWYPLTQTPEYGICPFFTPTMAQQFIEALCEANTSLKLTDFCVEPHDCSLSALLMLPEEKTKAN